MLALAAVERSRTHDGFLVSALRELHPSLMRRAAVAIISELCGEKPQLHHIDEVISLIEKSGSTQVAGGVMLHSAGGLLRRELSQVACWSVGAVIGCNKLPDYDIKLELFDNFNKINSQNFNKHLLDNILSYDKIKGQLLFGSMREGDKIRLRGRGVTKQLRRIFNELHIPPESRNGIPVLRDDEGVLWVYGVGVAERAAADENSDKVLKITVCSE